MWWVFIVWKSIWRLGGEQGKNIFSIGMLATGMAEPDYKCHWEPALEKLFNPIWNSYSLNILFLQVFFFPVTHTHIGFFFFSGANTTTIKLLHLKFRNHLGIGSNKTVKPEDQGVCCESVFLMKVRSYTQKVSLTWLPKHKWTRTITDKLTWAKYTGPQPYTKSSRQLRGPESGRNIIPLTYKICLIFKFKI